MNPTRTIYALVILGLMFGLAFYGFNSTEGTGNVSEKYSQVKIFASGESDFLSIERAGLDLDQVERIDNYVIAWLSAN